MPPGSEAWGWMDVGVKEVLLEEDGPAGVEGEWEWRCKIWEQEERAHTFRALRPGGGHRRVSLYDSPTL